jgi:Holliday junction DNA helicase RuvA
MIASVRGEVVALAPDSVIVEVGGIGVRAACSPNTLAGLRVGKTATLATSLVVRETELTLYGFVDSDEREVFEALQTATGVGPRLALAVLAVHGPDAIRRAVATEDLAALTLVPGIGRKGAQRIVLDLKDRLGPPGAVSDAVPSARSGPTDQVRAALIGLGYASREADEALALVVAGGATEQDTAALLKETLAVLRR